MSEDMQSRRDGLRVKRSELIRIEGIEFWELIGRAKLDFPKKLEIIRERTAYLNIKYGLLPGRKNYAE